LTIESRQRPTKDRDLLACIVPHDADLGADTRPLWRELELADVHVADTVWIEFVEAEIVHRIAVDRLHVDLLSVLEDRLRDHRTRHHQVSVGQHQPALGVHDERRAAGRASTARVEAARDRDPEGHDAGNGTLERDLPLVLAGFDELLGGVLQGRVVVSGLSLWRLCLDSRRVTSGRDRDDEE